MRVGTGSVTICKHSWETSGQSYLIIGQVDLRQPVAREHLFGEELKLVVLKIDNLQATHSLQGTVTIDHTQHD